MTQATDTLRGTYLVPGQAQKEARTNEWFDQIAANFAGFVSIDAAGTGDLTLTNTIAGQVHNAVLIFTGTLTGNRTVIVPTAERRLSVRNSTSGAFSLTVKTAGGTGIVIPQGTWADLVCDGTDVQAVRPGVLTLAAYAAGTAYQLTATPALLNFGTTDPTITLTQAGTYHLSGQVNLLYNAATFAATRTVTLKLRRTNNTAADVAGSSLSLTTAIITTLTATFAAVALPPVVYTTSNTDDALQVWGDVSVVPSAGSLDAVGASIVAVKLF
jgi:hypothetical protein